MSAGSARSAILRNPLRLIVALMIIVPQFPPIHSWEGHNYVVGAGIALVAGDQLWTAWRDRRPLYLALGVYTSFVLAGLFVQEILDGPRSLLVVVTGGAIAAAVVTLLVAARGVFLTKELDRRIIFESATIAFFATMLASVTYALTGTWLDLPNATGWLYAGIGGVTYALAFVFLTRKYT